MEALQVTDDQLRQWNQQGYFMVRQAIPRELAIEIRGVIRNQAMGPDQVTSRDLLDPMAPPDDSPAAHLARLRKLNAFCQKAPLIWHSIHAGQPVLSVTRQFLGDDILLKYDSCFLKPARTGSATPWHQDNGLWRDGETTPFSFWIAIDPATRENGCMQFIPGTHTDPIHTHFMTNPKAIHAELPPQIVRDAIAKHGLHYIEAQPGDMVCWQPGLFHYSPPNPSDHSRIAVAGVYTTPDVAQRSQHVRTFPWCMKQGRICNAFPPENYLVGDGVYVNSGPYPAAY